MVVDGIERSVSGVSPVTTCSQIIYALAHATTQRGKFVMIEKFRNIERRLAPNDRPLETLLKWREHAAQVTFHMKKIDGETGEYQSATLQSFRNPSTSSMPAQSRTESRVSAPPPDRNSSASLSSSTLPRRPPPPDYQAVMEHKCAMMVQRRVEAPNYVDIQRVENWSLNEKNKIYEDLEYAVHEEELNQLLKQQKNLRAILEPMIAMNWPQLYQQEVKKSHKLRASIEATKEAISKTRTDLVNVLKAEQELTEQLEDFEVVSVMDTSIDLDTSANGHSPQKVAA